jgi:heat shock protein HslJ
MKHFLVLATFIAAVVALSSCITINTGPTQGTPTTTSTPAIPVEDRTWILDRMGQPGSMHTVIAGRDVTARFDSGSSKVGGTSGCNTYSASYQINGDKLAVNNQISTKMLCFPNAVMQQETEYLDALQGSVSYKIEGNILTISCSGDRVMIFKAK